MRRIITAYITVVLLVSLGFFGVGTLASAQQQGASLNGDSEVVPAVAGERFIGR